MLDGILSWSTEDLLHMHTTSCCGVDSQGGQYCLSQNPLVISTVMPLVRSDTTGSQGGSRRSAWRTGAKHERPIMMTDASARGKTLIKQHVVAKEARQTLRVRDWDCARVRPPLAS